MAVAAGKVLLGALITEEIALPIRPQAGGLGTAGGDSLLMPQEITRLLPDHARALRRLVRGEVHVALNTSAHGPRRTQRACRHGHQHENQLQTT